MFSFLAHNVDIFAYIHGFLLMSMAVLVALLGRARAWDLPSKTLSAFFILLAIRLWTRVLRFNAELGPEGAWITLFFTLAAAIVLMEFMRREQLFSVVRSRWFWVWGFLAALLVIPPLMSIKSLAAAIPIVSCVLASLFFGALWFKARRNSNSRYVKLFWFGMWLYVLAYFLTPVGTADISSHMPVDLRFQYARSFLAQMFVFLFPLGAAFEILRNRFREIGLQRRLSALVVVGLFAWVFVAVLVTIGAVEFFGHYSEKASDRTFFEVISNTKSHLEKMSREAKIRGNFALGSGVVARAVEVAKKDKLAASRILDGMCQPKAEMVCYVMNQSGETIATSNWDSDKSFLGNNFAFRDYFLGAIEKGFGEQMAKGVTSFVPGFYSSRLFDFGNIGKFVFVVKSNVGALDETKFEREFVYVIDKDSNVLLSNDPHAAGKRLLPKGDGTEGYLPGFLENGMRFLFKGKSASFRSESLGFSSLKGVVVQQDDVHFIRLVGFVTGTPLLLSALLSCFLIALLFLSSQERMMEMERIQNLEKENAETRAMLFHQDKLASLGFLSAGVAHEINNPLAVVTGGLSYVRDAIEAATNWPERKVPLELVESATKASWRISEIVKRLLAFARADKATIVPVNVHVAVKESSEMVRYILEKGGVELCLDLGANSFTIDANVGELGQVLVNLLTNAKDALEKTVKPRVVVSVKEQGENVLIRCSDNGPGVPKELREKIFEPFFTTKELGKGTGLGLAISSTLVAAMGGKIHLESNEAGGATFVLTFSKSKVSV